MDIDISKLTLDEDKPAEQKPQYLYDVEIYQNTTLLSVVTVSAESPQDASTKAYKGMNVKVKRAYK